MNGKETHILLVEDNPADVRLTQEVIEDEAEMDISLDVVNDGEECLRFLRRQGVHSEAILPKLILLDWNLPKKNGGEVLIELKSDKTLKRIPVVVLTTSSAQEDIVAAYEGHASCFVTKPLDLDQFVGVIKGIEDFWLQIVKLPQPA